MPIEGSKSSERQRSSVVQLPFFPEELASRHKAIGGRLCTLLNLVIAQIESGAHIHFDPGTGDMQIIFPAESTYEDRIQTLSTLCEGVSKVLQENFGIIIEPFKNIELLLTEYAQEIPYETVLQHMQSTGVKLAGVFGTWGIRGSTKHKSNQRFVKARLDLNEQNNKRLFDRLLPAVIAVFDSNIHSAIALQREKLEIVKQEDQQERENRCCTRILAGPHVPRYVSCRIGEYQTLIRPNGEMTIEKPSVRLTLDIRRGKKVDLAEVGIPGFMADFSSPENGLELLCTSPDAKIWTTNAETRGAKVKWDLKED